MKTQFAALAVISMLFLSSHVVAHHGWSWTSGANIELTGVITYVRLGNPHGRLKVDVNGETWLIEVGQPWRNERAGLKQGDLAEGVEIKVIGEPSEEITEKRLKAVRLFLDDREYILYQESEKDIF